VLHNGVITYAVLSAVLSQLFTASASTLNLLLSVLCFTTGRRLIMLSDEFSCYNEIVINCFVLELSDM